MPRSIYPEDSASSISSRTHHSTSSRSQNTSPRNDGEALRRFLRGGSGADSRSGPGSEHRSSSRSGGSNSVSRSSSRDPHRSKSRSGGSSFLSRSSSHRSGSSRYSSASRMEECDCRRQVARIPDRDYHDGSEVSSRSGRSSSNVSDHTVRPLSPSGRAHSTISSSSHRFSNYCAMQPHRGEDDRRSDFGDDRQSDTSSAYGPPARRLELSDASDDALIYEGLSRGLIGPATPVTINVLIIGDQYHYHSSL